MRNKDEEAEGEEEDAGVTQASTEDNSVIDEYEEGCEYDREDNCEDTVLSNENTTKEEASSRHEGESSSSDSSERYDENDDDDDGTSAKDNTCYGDGNCYGDGDCDGRDDGNTGGRGGSA